jgi:hypothetical protein
MPIGAMGVKAEERDLGIWGFRDLGRRRDAKEAVADSHLRVANLSFLQSPNP